MLSANSKANQAAIQGETAQRRSRKTKTKKTLPPSSKKKEPKRRKCNLV
jgi:hypothetical protein